MSDEENVIVNMGAPEWVVTFGDLMSLLLCFFVLLLSFSEMDRAKYKEVAGSLERAFGVSYESKSMTPPKGVTMVAKDFDQPLIPTFVRDEYVEMKAKKNREEVGEKLKEEIEKAMTEMEGMEDMDGMKGMKDLIGVEVGENEVTIRMMGETAFDSGKAYLRKEMKVLLEKIATILKEQKGEITIIGHTDNVPIIGGEYKSNLGLSMARAASVADYLLNEEKLAPERVATMGFGEHRPIETNSTAEGRQKNRRVEIKLKSVPVEEMSDLE